MCWWPKMTTTIEVSEDVRDQLKEERMPHESNYSNTIRRLLGDSTGGQLWTEQEIRDMVRDELELARGGQ